MAIYFFDKNQTLIKIAPDSATFEAIQTQELDDDSLLKDMLSVTVKGDEKLLDAEYMAVKSYTGNAQTFDMYRIVTDSTPDKTMTFTGMSLAPYELNGHILKDLRPSNQSVEYTLNRILDGTDWRLGYIDDGLPNVATTFYYVSAKEALKELQSLVGCEFVFKVEISGQKITDKWIEIYKEMGNRTKKRFNYGTNALTVVRETNKADIYTALIGRGKGEEVSSGEDNESGQAGYGRKISFEDIEWSIAKGDPLNKPKGQHYLELPQATQVYGIKNIDGTMSARVGVVDFDDETDKNRLINLTYQQLLVSSRPKVLFKTTVANIGATGIGDTVTIHRHDLGIHYQTRVRKIVRNKLNDNKTQVELGDAVVTASTKRDKQNNATINNLTQEIEKVKVDVTTSQTSADGKNTIFYGSKEPERKRTGDTWFRPHPSIAGETQMLVWNGTAWELVVDSSDLTSVARAVEEAAEEAEQAIQSAKDADTRANEAIEKAGANANLLTTHQNTLNTINTVTLPDISSTVGDALANAKSAMDEAKKADGKIANYVTKNGLVNGTTVDTKINDATGEISKKITTVESKIPTGAGINLIAQSAQGYTGGYIVGLGEIGQPLVIKKYDKNTLSGYIDIGNKGISETFTFSKQMTGNGDDFFRIAWLSEFGNVLQLDTDNTKKVTIESPPNAVQVRLSFPTGSKPKMEKGSVATPWTPAPEDNYTQEEFKIFESTYDEDVKGINSTLTDLSNKKLDGSTYTTFYNNEYKKTAQGVTDTYTKVNKIIDANGNSTDTFAKAVYDKNATRQSADFKEVTKDLVKTATYTAGINGVNQSISEVEGKLDNLGSPNLLKNSWHNDTGNPYVMNTQFLIKSWDLDKKLEVGKTYTFRLFGFTNRAHFILSVANGNMALSSGMGNSTDNIIRRESTYNGFNNRNVWEETFTLTQEQANNMTSNSVRLYNFPQSSTNNGEIYWATLVEGKAGINWSPAPSDMATVIKTNEIERTAEGNKTTISNIKTKPGEQITGYQTIKERSDLYERVIGSSSEEGVKQNVARIVMTDSLFQTKVYDIDNGVANNLLRNAELKSMDYWTAVLFRLSGTGGLLIDQQANLWGSFGQEISVSGGEVVSASLDVRLYGADNSSSQYFELNVFNDEGKQVANRIVKPNLSKNWGTLQTLKIEGFKLPDTARKLSFVYAQNGGRINGSFSKPMLNIGYTVKPFSPSMNDKANYSEITQLSDNINLKVSNADLLNQINVQAKGVLITSGTNKLNVTPTTTYIENGTIKSAMIESLQADKITAGTLDASKVKVINIDAENITSNKTSFVQSVWNGLNAFTQIDANGIQMLGSGTWRRTFLSPTGFRLFNGQGAGNKAGAIGYFKSSTDLEGLANPLNEDFMWQNQLRHTIGIGVNESHLLSLGFQNPGAKSQDGYNPAITIDPQAYGRITNSTYTEFRAEARFHESLSFSGKDNFRMYNGLYLNTDYFTIKAETGVRIFRGNDQKILFGGNVQLHTNIDMNGNTISNQSDERLKKNIETLRSNDFEKLMSVRMISYEWKDPNKQQGTHIGFSAQELQKVYPELILKGEDGYLGIDSNGLAMAHMNAFKQHASQTNDRIAQLEQKIASLQDELAQLKGDINEIN